MAEYGISRATVSNWVCSYHKECQNNDEEKSQLKMMEELRRLRCEKAELEKKNSRSSDWDGLLKSYAFIQTLITTTSEMRKRGITLRNLIVVNGFKHFTMILMVSWGTVK